jgi:uncharacterized protein YraI
MAGYRKTGFLVLAFCLWVFQPDVSSAAQYADHQIGPISARVTVLDNGRGLTVRSAPSEAAPSVGVLTMGTRVINYPRFENGWVMLQSPMNGGWVRLDSLQSIRGIGTVVSVDRPEMCLRIRSGPGIDYDVLGCARMGERLRLTGYWSSNAWVEIEGPVPGWVSASQIRTDINVLVRTAPAPVTTVVSETVVPVPYPVPRSYPVYDYPAYGSSYWYPRYRGYRHPYRYGGFRYGGPGVGVVVGPRGGVGVRVGPVGVGVGPRGGVAVRAGGTRVRVR